MNDINKIRDDSIYWSRIVKGFVETTDGNETISCNGQHTGKWVYGYLIERNGIPQILGGTTKEEIKNLSHTYDILKNSLSRCTGLIPDGHDMPLFEHDVVDCEALNYTFKNYTILWDGFYLEWVIHNPNTNESYRMNAGWAYKFKQSYFTI
jgi:hypothetical protein